MGLGCAQRGGGPCQSKTLLFHIVRSHFAAIIFMLSIFLLLQLKRKLLAGPIKRSSLLDKYDNGRAYGVVISND